MGYEEGQLRPVTQQDSVAHVLVAEDDVPLANFLQRGLQNSRYAVDVIHDGQSALEASSKISYNLLVLDLNLPQVDGISILRQLRPLKPALPILVLTGRSLLEDRVSALDAGADDCLIKPFSFHELNARVRALLRRHGSAAAGPLQVGDLVLNRNEFRVERAGKPIEMTATEFSLLEYLMTNTRRPVSRSQIMEHVWKTPYEAKTNLVDVYVKYVRDKIDAQATTKLIRTIRGVGYVLAEN